MSEIREVVIIGSGPAGYTAALYAARAQLKPLLFGSSIFVGGSLTTTTEVENFPGFPDGVDGPVLMENMRAQAEKFGAEMVDDDIVSVDLTGEIKELTDSEGTVHRAKAVIIATGSGYRKLGLPNEEKLSGRGVSWCATCDGFFFRDRDIVVVGGGDTAMEEATFLTRFARSVTVVHRRSTLRASQVMRNRAFADDKISFAFDSEIVKIKEENGMLGGVALRDTLTGEIRERAATGLFIAIGHDPRTELFTGQLDLDDEGYIVVEPPSTRTNLPGVFAAGDVVDHIYRQAITAAGTGAAAGLDAERYLAALADKAPVLAAS
ncbi:Thioredoxin reductase [Streptomyces sp. ADI96-15]|uniref:thioredoxin-disulfide reductase n=1 Tax=Streptomyces TaxID=1883 RepID=UPI0003C2D27F|nr:MULTISPECIES: thioredoxin-disulfide reductase [unclassified Streptomyces]ESQ01558.1 thioredoxin reductase [Streptomyces sp. GBA 94-10 4N24]KQX31269.1 thioredoxin reductase [Streptomyces sp. Root1295]KRA41212.1 thioredoxin reductase [Streptomyces sp. Root63]RPK62391.1 Thioredoxin reductase [Streptomyces sp. ADI96-15]UZN57607.1 thioredoxin reductase [Streptomyces sp. GBA 94-10 4N24]